MSDSISVDKDGPDGYFENLERLLDEMEQSMEQLAHHIYLIRRAEKNRQTLSRRGKLVLINFDHSAFDSAHNFNEKTESIVVAIKSESD
jgi:hypothetical protein